MDDQRKLATTMTRARSKREVAAAAVMLVALAGTAWAAEQPAGTPASPAPVEPGRPVISRPKAPASMPTPTRPEGEVAQPPAKTPDATPVPVVPTGTSSTVRARPADPVSVAGTYNVSRFVIRYAGPTGGQLPPEDLVAQATVALEYDGVSYSPAKVGQERAVGEASVVRTVADLNEVGGNFTPAAISSVCSAIVRKLNDSGYVAIFVLPSSDDVDDSGADIRKGRREMTLVVYAGRVRNVTATVLDENGNKIEGSALGQRIVDTSPIQPGGYVNKTALDERLARLSRHPARRADASIAASAESGGSPFDIDLNYTVAQAKDWSVYANVANTGTRQTRDWRERFGFTHTNLTNNDDILSLDYVTAGFDKSNALFGSYELPVYSDWLRFKGFGGWNQYTASDIGISLGELTGSGWNLGGELIWSAIVKPRYELDLFAGVRYEATKVTNNTVPGFPLEGDANFTLMSVGTRGTYRGEYYATTSFNLTYEATATSSDQSSVDNLGRFDADRSFGIVKGGIEQSVYLEPLIDGHAAGTLAHELYGSVRGQSALGYRLPPTFQQTGGGFYTVRGYDESVTVGDDAILATLEYRLHVPRLYGISAQPGELFGSPFRWRPQEPLGQPDWDLIVRGFVDFGRLTNTDKKVFEADQTLTSAGVGMEWQMKRNLTIRADWGFVLRSTRDAVGNLISDSGDNRLHFSATIAF